MVPCAREPRRPPWLSGPRRESLSESESLRVSLRTRTSGPGLWTTGLRRDPRSHKLSDRARDQNSVFFHHIDGGRSLQGRDGGTPGAPAARSGTTVAVARESAGLTKMAATMERFVAVVKQYPGQQQVDLAVEIEVPGSWFGAGPMGSLTATEQRKKYKAQAVEYA